MTTRVIDIAHFLFATEQEFVSTETLVCEDGNCGMRAWE